MKTAIPTDATELKDMLGDPAKAGKLVQDGQLGEVIEAYARNVAAADADQQRQQAEQMQAQFAAMLKENGFTPDRLNMADVRPGNRSKEYNDEAAGAALDEAGLFKRPSDYLRAMWHRNVTPEAVALREKVRNDYSSTTGADGGFLVPESMRAQIMETALENAVVRPRAMVLPMATKTLSVPMVEDTDHTGALFGGLQAYWTEEGASVTATSSKFGVVKLEAKNLQGKSLVPNQLFQDSAMALEVLIRRLWGKAIAWTEDLGHLRGTGVGEPLGALHADNGALITVPKETGQPADTVVWENIVAMYSRMLPSSLGRAVWLANQTLFPQLATMALSVGTGGVPVWMPDGRSTPPLTLLGRPIIFTEKLNVLGDAGDLAFVDFDFYLIGDRQELVIESSEHADWDTFRTNFRLLQRGDGKPWLKDAITPHKGDTLSPFVQLGARA